MADGISRSELTEHLKSVTLNSKEELDPCFFEKAQEVFGNTLVVGKIISFATSQADLGNFRRVNHGFQHEATQKYRMLHKQISLETDEDIQNLLHFAKEREVLGLTPFPFSNFEVSFNLNLEEIEIFGKTLGQHVLRLSILATSRNVWMAGDKAATLLSYCPQIIEFQINSPFQFYVSEKALGRFPASFPCLSAVGATGGRFKDSPRAQSSRFLLDLVINRAVGLKTLSLPILLLHTVLPDSTWRVLRFLAQNRTKNLPLLSFTDTITINSFSILSFQKLITLNFAFTDIQICLYEVQQILPTVFTWLETQTNTLKNLSIEIRNNPDPFPVFPFPSLRVLKNLTIKSTKHGFMTRSELILLLVNDTFPTLETLRLERTDFSSSSEPSVFEFHRRFRRIPTKDPSWHTAIPHLTSLRIDFDYKLADDFRPALAYILTHLTRLEHLNLELTGNLEESTHPYIPLSLFDWEFLTGGSLQSPNKWTLSNLDLDAGVGEAEEPANGIYKVPSLRNMKALKTLRFFPRLVTNVEAVTSMSRTGHLVPLEKLTLSILPFDPALALTTTLETAAYKEELSRIHKEVILL